ncbi:MAG: hypothetical protein B5M48_02725 [Candidatus Omnitrophica bacterium 4484_213]|nr:MAG: hypothetical protein B5M48_02725 [Candidatus Omnitrophica bacterium 4484_213]
MKKPKEENYDGIWKRENGDMIVLEVKTSTWPTIESINIGNIVRLIVEIATTKSRAVKKQVEEKEEKSR